MVNYEKVKIHKGGNTNIGKGMATNKNWLRVELNSKNFKARLGKIKVVVCANKVACPRVEKLDFLHMNSWIMSHLGKGDLDQHH
jgi:hypothetical protein